MRGIGQSTGSDRSTCRLPALVRWFNARQTTGRHRVHRNVPVCGLPDPCTGEYSTACARLARGCPQPPPMNERMERKIERPALVYLDDGHAAEVDVECLVLNEIHHVHLRHVPRRGRRMASSVESRVALAGVGHSNIVVRDAGDSEKLPRDFSQTASVPVCDSASVSLSAPHAHRWQCAGQTLRGNDVVSHQYFSLMLLGFFFFFFNVPTK